MQYDPGEQQQGHRRWTIVRLFYAALIQFRRQFDQYEERVLAYAKASGIEREVLRLRPAELAGLLDFKSLEALRDGFIHELKDICHEIFRSQDRTDSFDRYISDIFHEISILKEEHYTVKTYAPQYEQETEEVELKYILDEAHAMFPQKLRHILYLFGRARERMEQHLPGFHTRPIFLRSLFLHRDGFVREAYPDGLRDFFRIMFEWGPLEGFYRVGQSFYHSGFFVQARETFEQSAAEIPETLVLDERIRRGDPAALKAIRVGTGDSIRLRSIIRSLRAKLRRARELESASHAAESAG
ncbi:MAG: hypothetical protein JXA90_00430 [Planctomycetes bacterium]|nr:hypothetical protein [Planctomycetota bacterium]